MGDIFPSITSPTTAAATTASWGDSLWSIPHDPWAAAATTTTTDLDILTTITTTPSSSLSSSMSFLTADAFDEHEAFTDSIQYLDTTITTMLGVFGVVMIVLIGYKVLFIDPTDNAIEQVITDFETTMMKDYPQKWNTDIRPQLTRLEPGTMERQQKIIQIMESMEQTDPGFMKRVQTKIMTTTRQQ
jgi:hypothetical protein